MILAMPQGRCISFSAIGCSGPSYMGMTTSRGGPMALVLGGALPQAGSGLHCSVRHCVVLYSTVPRAFPASHPIWCPYGPEATASGLYSGFPSGHPLFVTHSLSLGFYFFDSSSHLTAQAFLRLFQICRGST